MPIKVENLVHIYMKDTVFQHIALDNVSFTIEDGDFIGLIGHTGSGKSTLIQHLNGLLKPTSGKIYIDDIDINSKETSLKVIRQKVGLVFQYPEHQLFEETVYKDVAFGPINLKLSEDEVLERVKASLGLVGLKYDEVKDKSPFDLSGGQKRRVAIAGVLAMKPKVLILDEPTAGLDPRGRDEILNQIKLLHKKEKITIILVSHSMEDIAKLVDKILVMNKGKIQFLDTPRKVFKEAETLERIGLGVPQVSNLIRELRKKGFPIEDCISVEEAKTAIINVIRGKKDA
ncbi:energy-coupling factor transporter ATPase [Lutispora saccharofermentans]|uniref:Energy-coupling factor transporter ATP-binding protein EcfA2 n=1 Tax=Lutispora saccharofermentans TaxID=3024236 RepID=A0ABT1NI00_9FIRM|nr:energy-coupling factor transporter ATPase [Lutispora saccharofermentans]MCQ1530910.1 energy-coupling factor transporter ATPase [Lutispora saccharofermentans]